jgi:metallophosphoesterase (TIGR00282 family)
VIRILAIGDIVGRPGRRAVETLLVPFRRARAVDFVVANGENLSGGSGIRPEEARAMFEAGVDVLTGGDHVWAKKEVVPYIATEPRLLRPANYPEDQPGAGHGVFPGRNGVRIAVLHLQGRVFMPTPAACPFRTADRLLEEVRRQTPVVVVDVHAEATSEKVAMGWHLDGRASLVFGTHTHVQTADERVLPQGTGYITDCGMTGPYDGVIGRQKEAVLRKFLTGMPHRFEVAGGDVRLCGALAEVDERTGRCASVERVCLRLE